MKIIILISILFTSAFTGNVKMKVTGFNSDQDVLKTAKELVSELAPLLDKPLNWCTVKPTGEIKALRKGPVETKVLINVSIKCDHTKARKLLKQIWDKYDGFLNQYGDVVDVVMERQYSDYHLNWGYGLNDYDFIQLKLLTKFGGNLTFNNKCAFFRLTINDEFETIPIRIAMPGNLLKIIPTNQIPNRPPVKSYTFLVSIPNKLLESGELDVKLDRVWHLVNNEQYIRRY